MLLEQIYTGFITKDSPVASASLPESWDNKPVPLQGWGIQLRVCP